MLYLISFGKMGDGVSVFDGTGALKRLRQLDEDEETWEALLRRVDVAKGWCGA